MRWTIDVLDETVQDELDRLPSDMRARLARIVDLIEELGLERLREPYVKHLQGKLWEMRFKGKEGIARAIYVTAPGRRVVILHAFRKKSAKTPRAAVRLALARSKKVTA